MLEGLRHVGTRHDIIDTIVIDPGHGGDDNGAAWGYAEEDDINLAVSYLLRCELKERGYFALLTRERDKFLSLQDRVRFAMLASANLFVSIHCDAFHKITARGMSTHVHPHCSKQSEHIACSIQNALISKFPDHVNRGVKHSDFYVLRHTTMPAILIECEFLSNPETRKFLREPENQYGLAMAIADGILNQESVKG